MAKRYGLTWWGERWLDSLTHIDFSNRLPRGMRYAGNGSVRSIDIKENTIKAAVQGTRPRPYKIEIIVPSISEKHKEILTGSIKKNPLILSRLLNRELPQELLDIAEKNGIKIFPSSWKDFKMSCSCPDWAVPCKHLAAVIYLVANEIDKNPFIVFDLHGYNIIEAVSGGKKTEHTKSVNEIKSFCSCYEKQQEPEDKDVLSVDKFDSLDFSPIEPLFQKLLSFLNEKPLFFTADFKEIFAKSYKNVSERIKSFIQISHNDNEYKYSPEKISEVSIRLDTSMDLLGFVFFENISGKKKEKRLTVEDCINLLISIEEKYIRQYCDQLVGLYAVYLFSIKLLEQGAYVPEIMKVADEKYCIRWIPALFDESVKKVFDQMLEIPAPEVIVVHITNVSLEEKRLIQSEKLIMLCNIFISFFIEKFLSSKLPEFIRNDVENKIFFMFFKNRKLNFLNFTEKEAPNTIQQWLSKFHLIHKNFIPVLKVNEQKEDKPQGFSVEVFVENKSEKISEVIPVREFFISKKYGNARLDVLRDLDLLSEYFSDLKPVIESKGRQNLFYNSDEFASVLMKIFPLIQLLGINVFLPKSLKSLVYPKLSMQISSKKQSGISKNKKCITLSEMFRFQWNIALGDELISPEEFMEITGRMSGIVQLKDKYIFISKEEIDSIISNLKNPPELSGNELLKVALAGTYNNAAVGLSKDAAKIISSMRTPERITLPDSLRAELRPYQISGYQWMYNNSKLGFGSLIADDMGLGKTLQVISLLLKFRQEKKLMEKKALVIVPTTLLTNWQKEIEVFAPDLKPFIYYGHKRKLDINDCDLVISTYGLIRSDIKIFKEIEWHVVIVDESQNIKNNGTEQTKCIKSLKSDIRIAMSGTPVENRLSEYWSVLDFTNRGYLGSEKHFNEEYAVPIQIEKNHKKLEEFKKITEPFILRRLKTDKTIIKDLPDKIENNQYCSLTKEQAALYQNVIDATMRDVEENKGIARAGHVLKLMTSLKQICNHPSQFLKKGNMPPDLSGKTNLLFELIETILENNEKTLLFSQYQEMGELLVKFIEERFGIDTLFLHGAVPRKKRDEMVSDFQTKKHMKIFILSLKAGGTGLNLTAARNVIHYDLWWNPAVEAQATDRAYRIGQKENVMVYRLLTKGTFEEKIEEMLKSKKNLADMTVASGEKWISELSDKELKDLIKLR